MTRRVGHITAAICLVATLVVIPGSPASAALDATGRWGPLLDWPVIPINSALTPDGRVMTFGTDTAGNQGAEWNFDMWTPSTGVHQVFDNTTFTDLFCSVQVFDPIRDVIFTAGGDDSRPGSNQAPIGFTSFSSDAGIRNEAPMSRPRWYPSATVLPNGEIVVEGGSSAGSTGPAVLTPERYTPGVGWTPLTGATSAYAYGEDQLRFWYPRSWVAPDGRLFGMSGSSMYYLDPRGDGAITAAGTLSGENIGATSTAVMYRPGRIIQVGGGLSALTGGPGSTAASIVDINGSAPTVTDAAPMTYSRHWPTSTVLPTGDVLVSGGSSINNVASGVAYQPELWNPATNTWTVLAAEERMRLYHSTALLLPDGRVLVGGGGAPGPQANRNAQIYEPPYLFSGDRPARRPVLSAAPTTIGYGATFPITVSPSATRATLVRASAVTHSFNGGQRFMELQMTGSGKSRRVTAPANGAVAPPGLYLLFVLDAAGTPSVAKLVNIEVPGAADRAVLADGFENGGIAAAGELIAYAAGQSFGAWSVRAAVSRDQGGHHGGFGSAGHHLNLNDDGRVTRTVSGLTPGVTYQLSLRYARHKGAAGPVSAKVSIAGLSRTWSASNASDGDFATLSLSFTATAASHTLTLRGAGSTAPCCGMIVDDVSIWRSGSPPLVPAVVDSFEQGEVAAENGYLEYAAGATFGPWTVRLPVSRDQAGRHLGLGRVGHHLNLDDNGQVTRTISGLTPGATYRLTLRYARHTGTTGPVSAKVSIGDLDHTWSASNGSDGDFATLSQSFTATAASQTLTLSGAGSATPCCGMIVDNIVIWQEAPAGGAPSPAVTSAGHQHHG